MGVDLIAMTQLIGLVLAACAGGVTLWVAIQLRRTGRKGWHEMVVGSILLFGAATNLTLGLAGLYERLTVALTLNALAYVLWTTIALWALREWKDWRAILTEAKRLLDAAEESEAANGLG